MADVIATIMVCVDCLMVHANGEVEGPTDREPWGLLPGADVAMSDGEDCDCPFSYRPCDACGSELAGMRHEFAVFSWGPDRCGEGCRSGVMGDGHLYCNG